VGGDFNEDVMSQTIQRWCQEHQLSNAIGTKFNINGEAIYHRGNHSIDAILVSHTIHPIKAGYLPFGAFPSDHQCLWIDISTANAYGYKPPRSFKISSC
jgi:hypothetical protein